jgi:hypothetical protein
MSSAGAFPIELASKKVIAETFPIAAAKVTSPDGTKGISLNDSISRNAVFPSESISVTSLGNFSSFVCAVFLKPFLYKKNATMAPSASPKKEMRVPSQKPKKIILAAVIKTLGTSPSTAIKILMARLMKTASCALLLNISIICSFNLIPGFFLF